MKQSSSHVYSSITKLSSPTPPPPSPPSPPPPPLPSSPPLQRCKLMYEPSSSLNTCNCPSNAAADSLPSSSINCASSSSRQVHQRPLSPSLQQYVKHLQIAYISEDNPAYDKEHDLLQTKAKSFIKNDLVHKNIPKYMSEKVKKELMEKKQLGQVEAIQNLKKVLPICDVCVYADKNGTRYAARSVLVEGGPGIGKTTFAFELCKRWAKREALQDWTVVVFLKLRDQRVREAKTLHDLLYHPVPEVRETVVKELVEQAGEGMLLILDGYDELTENQRHFGSIIQQLMSRQLLRKATLMVTSRPLATRTLDDNFQQSVDQHIELLGFTEESIGKYIESACGDNSELVEDFKSYLSFHPFSSLLFNPLLCAIFTELYCSHWESGNKDFAPKTLTQLYTGLVHTLLVRYLFAHWPNKNWRIRDLNDLPQPQVNQQFIAVTKLAAEGIEKQQYEFDGEEWKIPSDTFSLMQKEEVMTPEIGKSTSFYFLHRALQEFLAAVHYSRCPEQLPQSLSRSGRFPLCSLLKKSEDPHWQVVQFLAGRTKLKGISSTFLCAIGLHDDEDDDEVTKVDMLLLHLLYETQYPELIQSTLVTNRKYLSATGRSPLDWYVIGYCIANSASTWRLNKKAKDEPSNFDHLVTSLGLAHPESSEKGKIVCLHISGDWYENCNVLLKLQPTYTKTLTTLELVHVDDHQNSKTDGKESKCDASSNSPCSCPELQELKIINARNDFSPFIGICLKPNYLQTILLNNCTLSSEMTTSLIDCLRSSNCVVHKLVLHLLHFFGDPDCDRLTTAIVKSTMIKKLLFTNLKASSLEELASGIKQNVTIEEIAVGSTLAYFKNHLPNLVTAMNCSAVKKLWLSNSYKEWFGNSKLSDSGLKIVWFNKDELFKYWGLREMRSVCCCFCCCCAHCHNIIFLTQA